VKYLLLSWYLTTLSSFELKKIQVNKEMSQVLNSRHFWSQLLQRNDETKISLPPYVTLSELSHSSLQKEVLLKKRLERFNDLDTSTELHLRPVSSRYCKQLLVGVIPSTPFVIMIGLRALYCWNYEKNHLVQALPYYFRKVQHFSSRIRMEEQGCILFIYLHDWKE
jgi:hypothetical protein